jgi:hypothetical protein
MNFYLSKHTDGILDHKEIEHVQSLISTLKEYCEVSKTHPKEKLHRTASSYDDDLFGNLQTEQKDEVDTYPSQPIANPDCDPILWWKTYDSGRESALSGIAINLFATQASSVASERVFSGARDIITDKRFRLSEETINAIICCKSWMNSYFF